MKVRVRVSKGRPAISLRTEEAASLGSLKEELTSSRLITYDIPIIIYFQNMQADINFGLCSQLQQAVVTPVTVMITLMSVLWASETPTKVEFPCSVHVAVVRLTGQMYVWGKRIRGVSLPWTL